MYLTTEGMSKMKMDVAEAVVSRVKNVTEIVVVSMMIHSVVSMRMILVGIVVSMLMMNEVSMLMMNVASMMRTNVVSMMRMNVVSVMRTVVPTTMTGVLDEVVAVSGCAENKGVGDDDLDDVKESWLVSFGSPADCDPLFRGEELLESSSSISEDINMSAT